MSVLAPRLFLEKLRSHNLTESIKADEDQVNSLERQSASLRSALEKENKMVDNLTKLQEEFENVKAELENEYTQAQLKDKLAREDISAEFQAHIARVTEVESEIGQKLAAEIERANSLGQKKELFESRLPDLRIQHDKMISYLGHEVENIQKKQDDAPSYIQQVKKELEEQSAQLEKVRQEHDEVRRQVDVYAQRFVGIKENLDKTKEAYEKASVDKERRVRQMRTLENDRAAAIARAQRVQKERNAEAERVSVLDAKAETLRKQIKKFQELTSIFEQSITGCKSNAAESEAAQKKNE
ncbi:unnamed protein product [Phytomonas sp. Hart1]|nr:unnamed protein product [Phytomonas sp. Hart1]|eukprot:CCW70010.1 unnamed protein product [Phytomonas sp. isolate Hart1]